MFLSCSSEHNFSGQVRPQADDAGAATLLENPETIVFSDIQKHILKPSCVSCHGDSAKIESNIDLRSFESLLGQRAYRKTLVPSQPENSLVYKTLIIKSGSRRMPPTSKPQLSEDQINLMFQWIKYGAKLEAAQKVERVITLAEIFQPYFDAPETIDYSLIKEHVFDNSCTKCHSKDEPTADREALTYGQNMTTYQDLFKSPDRPFSTDGVVKGKLVDTYVADGGNLIKNEGSRIYRSVAIYQSMPPAEDGYEPMDSMRIKLLRLWILNCAIEDYEAIKENDNLNESAIEKKSSKVRSCIVPNNL